MASSLKQKSPKKWYIFVFFLFLSTAYGMHFETNIPDAGQEGQFVITNNTELYIGKVMMHKIYSSDLVSSDPILSEYLNILGKRISQAAPRCDFKFFYFPIETSELNAFAFFGGHVAVHTGLIMMVENESELAAVLAHETAHVTQRHLARILTQQKRFTPLTIAELLAAAAIGVVSPDAGIGLATAALGSQAQQMINFTREHEYEADRFAVEILSRAGFDPMALPEVFKNLSDQTRYMEKPPEYLLTHPVFENRMADAYNRAEKLPAQKKIDSLLFHLVRARIDANSYESAQVRLKRIKNKLDCGGVLNKISAEYAYALALAKARKFTQAKEILHQLIEHNLHQPEVWVFELSLAEVALLENNDEEALSLLSELAYKYPKKLSTTLPFAEVLTQVGKPEHALDILLALKPKQLENPFLYQHLARAYGKMGLISEVHQSKAEWHYLRGEYATALQQLALAKEKAKSKSLIAEINYRTANIQQWIARQKEAKL